MSESFDYGKFAGTHRVAMDQVSGQVNVDNQTLNDIGMGEKKFYHPRVMVMWDHKAWFSAPCANSWYRMFAKHVEEREESDGSEDSSSGSEDEEN